MDVSKERNGERAVLERLSASVRINDKLTFRDVVVVDKFPSVFADVVQVDSLLMYSQSGGKKQF